MDNYKNIPKFRPLFQRWIMVLYEPPHHSPNLDHLSNVFNLTATYRIDSNFSSLYYESFHWINSNRDNVEIDFLKNKTKFAVAIISNCRGSSNRLELISSLRKFINVDIYGKCGKECPTLYSDGKTRGDCKEIVSKEYKFYFAFENSICKDYATEKFFNILILNPIIPVVLGGADYSYYVFI